MKRGALQTDVLRKETGADDIVCDVLLHDLKAHNRLVILSSVKELADGQQKIPQSIAYANLANVNDDSWPDEVAAVDALLAPLTLPAPGRLMGDTFCKANMTVRQNRLYRKHLPIEDECIADLYEVPLGTNQEIDCYEFWVQSKTIEADVIENIKLTPNVLYAVVIELKNPHRTRSPWRPRLGLSSFLESAGITNSTFVEWFDAPDNIDASFTAMIDQAQILGEQSASALHQKARTLYSALQTKS